MYDLVIGRVLSPDAFVQASGYTQSYNRYSYCMNNPLRYTDPSGYRVYEFNEYGESNIQTFWGLSSASGRFSGMPGSGNHWTDGSRGEYGNYMIGSTNSFYNMYGSGAWNIAQSLMSNLAVSSQWRQGLISIEKVRENGGYWVQTAYTGKSPNSIVVDGITYTMGNSGGGVFKKWMAVNSATSRTDLNLATLHQNILGTSYVGPDNPKSYNNEYNYSYAPTNLAEYPAIGHDRRYGNLKAVGASGLFIDTRTIGADWKFVGEELSIASMSFLDVKTRAEAALFGIGLSLFALPKTLIMLSQPNGLGFTESQMWYNLSNDQVNNVPSIR